MEGAGKNVPGHVVRDAGSHSGNGAEGGARNRVGSASITLSYFAPRVRLWNLRLESRGKEQAFLPACRNANQLRENLPVPWMGDALARSDI